MAMNAMHATGLVTLGFLLGIIVSELPDLAEDRANTVRPVQAVQMLNWVGESVGYSPVATSGHWSLFKRDGAAERDIAIAWKDTIRVVLQNDGNAFYISTYKDASGTWEGRLVDFGNDGSVEIADISGGHCENFGS